MKTSALACLAIAGVCAACAGQPASPTNPSIRPAVTVASTDGGGKAKVADMAVTTTVMDVDAIGTPLTIASDGGGAYTNGVSSVISILTANGYNNIANGDWQFDSKSSATRKVGHGFYAADAIAVDPPLFTVPANPPYAGQQNYPSRLQVECTFVQKSMLTMSAGSAITCGMLNDWVASSTVSGGLQTAPTFTGFPETTDVQIICNAVDSLGCKDWTLEPLATGSIGRLMQSVAGHGNNVTKTDEGDFHVRFLIHVTRP